MKDLVEAIGQEIVPLLREPFAFFGHSMGADHCIRTHPLAACERPSASGESTCVCRSRSAVSAEPHSGSGA